MQFLTFSSIYIYMYTEYESKIDYKTIKAYAKLKETLCLINEHKEASVIVCRNDSDAGETAKEIRSFLEVTGQNRNVHILMDSLSKEEQDVNLRDYRSTDKDILVIPFYKISMTDFSKTNTSFIVHLYVPSTSESYTQSILQIRENQHVKAYLIWNYMDTIWGHDFIQDVMETSTAQSSDGNSALLYIKRHNRIYNIKEAGYNLTRELNSLYIKRSTVCIWTFKDTKEVLSILIREEYLKIYSWPFKDKVGTILLKKR